jgi:hypothetical protein
MTSRGKELEALAIVKRVERDLMDVPPMLKRDRDADQLRGQITAARAVLREAANELDARLFHPTTRQPLPTSPPTPTRPPERP